MSLLQDGGVLKAYTDIINNPVYTSWLDYDEPPQNCQGEEDKLFPMGDDNKEITEDDMEKAFNEGNFEEAVLHFTSAIELNSRLAVLHAKRANALLKLNKPNGAIPDCDKAVSLNANSAQGHKFRGRAHRLLGNFVEVHRDLAMACKLDVVGRKFFYLKLLVVDLRQISVLMLLNWSILRLSHKILFSGYCFLKLFCIGVKNHLKKN
uniref:TPR_REGION domain-containing protein n=1 Tax=Wuchereria bancrofti TaxID=6293 RepID=A0A1I8EN31_WUCBA